MAISQQTPIYGMNQEALELRTKYNTPARLSGVIYNQFLGGITAKNFTSALSLLSAGSEVNSYGNVQLPAGFWAMGTQLAPTQTLGIS